MKKLAAILAAVLFGTQGLVPVGAEDAATRKARLSSLIDRCEQAGLSVDYEKSALAILNYFDQDRNTLGAVDPDYLESSLENVYEEAKSNLELYLAGKKTPKTAPRYQTGTLRVQGGDYYGTVSDGENSWEQPVFLTGVGHWYDVRNELALFKSLGINHLQTEIKMSEVLTEPQAIDEWEIVHQLGDPTEAELSEAERQHGKKSLHMYAENNAWATNKLTAVHQTIPVQPNTTYTYAFRVKRNGAHVFWFSLHGRTKDIDLYQPGKDTKWVRYTGTYTTGADETQLDLTFVNESNADVYIDNVLLYETNENLVANPSFETAGNPYCHINYDQVNAYCSFLKEAEKNGITVDLLLAIHEEPSFLLRDHPELKYHGYGFFRYNPLLDGSKEFIREFVRGICGRAKNYESLVSICMSNEPSFISAYEPEQYNPAWQAYLEDIYQTPAAMSQAYGKTYQSFSECNLSENGTYGGYNNKNKMYLDYKHFNDRLFAGWYQWFRSEIQSYIPGMRVHSKMIQYMGGDDRFVVRSQIHNGMNMETLTEATDLNGYDLGATIRTAYAYETCDLWNDYSRSVRLAPNVNSENHIVNGTSAENAQAIYSMLWQGALHGLSQTALWIWDNDCDRANRSGYADEMISLKPEHLWRLSCASKDLLRLSEEITAIRNAQPKVGILFSETARNYSDLHMSALMRAYQSAEYLGESIRILTDTVCDTTGLDVIIVPEAEYVSDDVYRTLSGFSGSVLIYGRNSLTKDADGNSRGAFLGAAENVQILDSAFSGLAIQTPTVWQLMSALRGILGEQEVSIQNAQTGEIPVGISYQHTVLNGKKLVSICNYTENPIQLRVLGAESWRDRIQEESMGETVIAEPDIPLLLEEEEPIDQSLSPIPGTASGEEQLLRIIGAEVRAADGGFILKTNREAAVWVDGSYAGKTTDGVFTETGLANGRTYEITLAAASDTQAAGRFYKTYVTPTRRYDQERDVYEPVNPLMNVYWGNAKISWINPDTNLLQKASVYRGDTLLSDALSATPGKTVTYLSDYPNPADIYRIVLEYSNGERREFSLSGGFDKTLGNTWRVMVNNRNNTEKMYSYRAYRTSEDVKSGSYALRLDTNYDRDYDGTYLYLENRTSVSLSKGKTYRLGIWMKSRHASSVKCAVGQNESWLIQRSGNMDGETVTNQDWRFYSVPITAAADEEGALVRIFCDESGEFVLDDLTLYEVAADGNLTGRNLLTDGGFETADSACNEVQNVSATVQNGYLELSWSNPEENFSGIEIRRNGRLAARLGTGAEAIRLPAAPEDELIGIRTFNACGIKSDGVFAEVKGKAIRLFADGAETDTLIPGKTYTLQAPDTAPDQYLASFQNGRLLQGMKAENGTAFTLPEGADRLSLFRWNGMQPTGQPEVWYQIMTERN